MNELVLEKLMDWVMDGTLSMGEHLNAEKIAQKLGVSRMPVREAFTMLEQLGLAQAIPYVGFKLLELDRKDVMEIYLLRQLLEPELAAISAHNIDENGIEILESIHADIVQEFENAEPNPRTLYMLNREFHFTLYQHSNMDRLFDTVSSLWNSLSFCKLIYSKRYISNRDAANDMIHTHEALIQMIREKDYIGIRNLLKKDLSYHTIDVPEALFPLFRTPELD